MKKIEAIVRPHKVEEIRESLIEAGISGMTLSEVRGYGRQKGHKEVYRGSEYDVGFVPKILLMVVVSDNKVENALAVIMKAAKTGDIGDGKIFVSNIEEVIRVRTGESGDASL